MIQGQLQLSIVKEDKDLSLKMKSEIIIRNKLIHFQPIDIRTILKDQEQVRMRRLKRR